MQFKSILAVLALAVAAVASPVEPVAVNLVARTTPVAPPAGPTNVCPVGQTLISKCTVLGVPLTATSPVSAGLISLIQLALSLGLQVQCLLNQVNVGSNQAAACCTLNQGDATNTQGGLINLNVQNANILGQCSNVL